MSFDVIDDRGLPIARISDEAAATVLEGDMLFHSRTIEHNGKTVEGIVLDENTSITFPDGTKLHFWVEWTLIPCPKTKITFS